VLLTLLATDRNAQCGMRIRVVARVLRQYPFDGGYHEVLRHKLAHLWEIHDALWVFLLVSAESRSDKLKAKLIYDVRVVRRRLHLTCELSRADLRTVLILDTIRIRPFYQT